MNYDMFLWVPVVFALAAMFFALKVNISTFFRKKKAWKMFLDDERQPVGTKWVVVRSYDEFVSCLRHRANAPTFISFDHDLGGEKSGKDCAQYLIERDLDEDGDYLPRNFGYYVHSQNPVGAENIRGLLDHYLAWKAGE